MPIRVPAITRTAARPVLLCLSLVWIHPAIASANTVNHWNASAGRAALTACISPADDPLHESRMYAMMHVAIHDALNAIDRRAESYAFTVAGPAGASADAAVAAAARDVLVATIAQIPAPFPQVCLDAGIASVQADYSAALAAIPDGAAKTAGIALGQASAAAILARRVGDGADTPLLAFDFPQGTRPGTWRFTDLPFAFAPGWGRVRPFALQQARQFRPSAPYPVTSHLYTADFEEVKAFGGDGVTTPSARTADQTQIALFWLESSPLSWNRMAREVGTSRGLDAWESARLFALLNMAMADGYVASWRAKYDYLFWRPVTASCEVETDGNPNTAADPTWTPLQPTYPIPDHDSAHSVEGGAAAEAMTLVFGSDDIAFSACSLSLPSVTRCSDASPVRRSFRSFSEAAAENALSRVLVGIHFRHASEEGVRHGRKIAEHAVRHLLRPVP